MKKAIIYSRTKVNLSDCNLTSVEAQLKSCKDFAEKNDVAIIGVRSDITAIGTASDFSAWKEIVKDRKPNYDCILVHDYSRIGRDLSKAIKDRATLKDKGVRIVSATENLSDEYDEALFDLMTEYLRKGTKKC